MRSDLINEYVQARMQFSDLDDEQLVSACSSYAMAE